MYIRFHKGQFVDAVTPGPVGVQPVGSPGDIVWSLPSDINPSKTIEENQNVQATDPITGQLLFNEDGTPQWETETVANLDGTSLEVIVTQQVSVTYTLIQNPNIFTQDDIKAVAISYEVVS